MKKITAAVVGYGNIASAVIDAIEASNDMECVGIVRRNAGPDVRGYKVVTDIRDLGHVDVAVLTVPSRAVEQTASRYLAMGIRTVDSFDIHHDIPSLRSKLSSIAVANSAASIISAGWDPGTDSVIRALLKAMAPKGLTYTNFGPGRSMGHTVAAKAIPGVKDALSMTIPLGTGIHRRMVYVELLPEAEIETVEAAIKKDPYFSGDETHVIEVSDIDAINDVAHGVDLQRDGVSGKTHNQRFRFQMEINNPALTGQVLVCAARAVMKCAPGCYTMIEIPPVDLLEGDTDSLIAELV